MYADYAISKATVDIVEGKEFLFKESKIKLKDSIIGVPDTFTYVHFLEYHEGMTMDKPANQDPLNEGHTRMVKFYNFLLARESGIYFR